MSKLPHLSSPSIFVILGATGDLAKKKIIPSLWLLFNENLLPDKCSVLAFADTNFSKEEFNTFIKDNLKEKIKNISEIKLKPFLDLFTYINGDFNVEKSFNKILDQVNKYESLWSVCSNKVFFLAATPHFYENIFNNLAKVGLNVPCGGNLGWTRILIEKPFGYDLKSAEKLQKLLDKYFKEEQIYRIDHYLAKEIVQGISNFRFSNNLFESSWSNELVEKIEIRLFESIGVEQRGSFYDSLGAFRDVGQNHLLELLSLITMKTPLQNDILTIRKNRVDILSKLKPWTKKDIINNTYQAQYEGYKNIEGVKNNSQNETFFSIKTEIEDPLWIGVPIIIEAGKQCKEARKEIVVTMKHPPVCFACEPGHHTKNQVIFQIEPKAQVLIKFWSKKPGFENTLEERSFTFFLYEKEEKTQYVEEYAKLFYEAMRGDLTLFVDREEVKNLWRFTDPLIKAWRNNLVPLSFYKPGTTPQVKFKTEDKNKFYDLEKKIGIIGLGKMGANISRRLTERGWRVYGFNKTEEETKILVKEGLYGTYSVREMVEKISGLKVIWLMIPAGGPVDEILFGKDGLIKMLKKGDIIIDGGNSFYKDSISRFKKLKAKGIGFIDVGVSGGPSGARNGASLMIGGEKEVFKKVEKLFSDIAIQNGYQFFDGPGAGHFVKMIHNGIEYGMMQSIAEGFTILKKSKYKLNLSKVTDVYNHGSVIESRLIGWLKNAIELHGEDLKNVKGQVSHTGEGAWTVKTAKDLKIKAKIIEESLKFRIQSNKKSPSVDRQTNYTGKILSAIRGQFGGHSIKK